MKFFIWKNVWNRQRRVYHRKFLPEDTEFHTWKEGVGNWAYYSAQQEYDSEEEVREEIRGYIVEEKENIN